MNSNHHPLLFSFWFNFLYKLFFKRVNKDKYFYNHHHHHSFQVYGDIDKGYFIKFSHGIKVKAYIINKSKYAYVSIFHKNEFLMNYKTEFSSIGSILKHNPLFFCAENLIQKTFENLKKATNNKIPEIFSLNLNHEDLKNIKISTLTNVPFNYGFDFKFEHHGHIIVTKMLFNKFYFAKEITPFCIMEFSGQAIDRFSFDHLMSLDKEEFSLKVGFDYLNYNLIEESMDYECINNINKYLKFMKNHKLEQLSTFDGEIVGICITSEDDKPLNPFYSSIIDFDVDTTYFLKFYEKFDMMRFNTFNLMDRKMYDNAAELKKAIDNDIALKIKKYPSVNFFDHAKNIGMGKSLKYLRTINDDTFALFEMMDI